MKPKEMITGLLLFTIGCTPAIKGTSRETYRLKGLMDGSFSGKGLAILPVTGLKKEAIPQERHDMGNPLPFIPAIPTPAPEEVAPTQEKKPPVTEGEKFKRVATDLLTGSFKRKREDIFIVPPEKCLALIKEWGLMESYRRNMVEYASIWILEKDFLKDLGKSLNIRYVLVSQLVRFSRESQSSLIFVWKWGRLYMERTVIILGQIWDTQLGEVVWTGHGTACHIQGIYRSPPNFEQLAIKACDGFVDRIP